MTLEEYEAVEFLNRLWFESLDGDREKNTERVGDLTLDIAKLFADTATQEPDLQSTHGLLAALGFIKVVLLGERAHEKAAGVQ